MKYIIIPVLLFWANVASSQLKIKFTKVENAASKNIFIKLEHCLSMDETSLENEMTDIIYPRVRKFFDTSKMNKRIRQLEKLKAQGYDDIICNQSVTLDMLGAFRRWPWPRDTIRGPIDVIGWNEYKRINQIEDTVYNKNTVFFSFVSKGYESDYYSRSDYYFIEFDNTGKKVILMGRIFNEEIETQKLQKLIKRNPLAGLINLRIPLLFTCLLIYLCPGGVLTSGYFYN
jgi:hypothetical protein